MAAEALAGWTTRELAHDSEHGSWQLTLALPPARLRELVSHLWAVRGRAARPREGILPTGCVEVMFTLGPSHRVLGEPATASDVDCRTAWVSGLQPGLLTVESPTGTDLVGAALRPLGAAALLPLPMDDVAGRVVDLGEVLLEETAACHGRLLAAGDARTRLGRVAALVERRLAQGREVHPDVRLAA